MLEDIVANHKRLVKRRTAAHQQQLQQQQTKTQGRYAQQTENDFEKERLFTFNRALVSEYRQATSRFFDKLEVLC